MGWEWVPRLYLEAKPLTIHWCKTTSFVQTFSYFIPAWYYQFLCCCQIVFLSYIFFLIMCIELCISFFQEIERQHTVHSWLRLVPQIVLTIKGYFFDKTMSWFVCCFISNLRNKIKLLSGVTVLLSLTVFQQSVSEAMPITSLQIPLLGNM